MIPATPTRPPQPATLLLSKLAFTLFDASAQLGTAFIFLLPILGAVNFPVLAEIGREGLGQQQQLDVVSAGSYILLKQSVIVVGKAGARVLLIGLDVVIAAARGGEEQLVRDEEAKMAEHFAPPRSLDEYNLAIHAAQAAIGDSNPTARPAHAALPLACGPEEYDGDNSRGERQLLARIDDPVNTAADASAVLARAQEQGISKVGGPQCEQGQHEGVLAAAGAQGQVLGAQRGLEDQQIEIDLGGRRGQQARGVDGADVAGGSGHLRGGDRGRRSALDDLVELRLGHGYYRGCFMFVSAGRRRRDGGEGGGVVLAQSVYVLDGALCQRGRRAASTD